MRVTLEESFSRLTNYLFQHRVVMERREMQALMRFQQQERNTALDNA